MEEIKNSLNSTQSTKDLEKILNENNRYRPAYSFGFIVVLILLSIAYASLAYNIGVKMNPAEVKGVEDPGCTENCDTPPPPPPYIPPRELRWQIEFDNVQELPGSITPDKTTFNITDEKIAIGSGGCSKDYINTSGNYYKTVYYKFTVDIVNKGEMDAKIYNIVKTQLTSAQSKYLKYIVTYADGTEIKVDDVLNVNDRRTVSVLVEFDEDLVKEDLPEDAVQLTLEYKIQYVEK